MENLTIHTEKISKIFKKKEINKAISNIPTPKKLSIRVDSKFDFVLIDNLIRGVRAEATFVYCNSEFVTKDQYNMLEGFVKMLIMKFGLNPKIVIIYEE